MAATSFFSVRGVERSPVWFAGYVLGQIKRSATGGDYPPPSFSEDNVPDDAPPDFLSALHYWYEDPLLAACVENGVVTTPLPPLKWLEMSKQVPPTSPTSVQSAADDEAGSGMEYDGDGSDGGAADDGHDAAGGEDQSGNMRDVVMSWRYWGTKPARFRPTPWRAVLLHRILRSRPSLPPVWASLRRVLPTDPRLASPASFWTRWIR